ncbi:Na+/H+ antiporter [Larkinella soli]|uniref:Na+/H+ antiporter n=1 Tax=Larkinella soli TaxID=1770527 RepID=UPI000FFC3463|nr:Na+/H+ antiporter [Larkinella soli]
MQETFLLCLSLVLGVSLLVMVGQRLRISYPIFLVLGGLAISFLPGIPPIAINPELIFLIFLPPLLYEAAWFTSWREFWKWRRVIITFAFGVVIFTAGAVALVSNALIPGFTLALGFLLGGIISPPDAVAATSVFRALPVPRRLVSVVEGESLVNDASSLIVFRFALGAVLSGTFVWQDAATSFVWVTLAGIGVGMGVALVFYVIHRWIPTTPSIHTVLTLVTPYLMYITAELAHVSGVMAVVSGGLFLSFQSTTIFTARNRMQGLHTWATVGFMLNGLVFILIGLQLPVIVESLGDYSLKEAIGYGLVITLVITVVRMVSALGTSLFTRFISRYIRTNDSNPGWRMPFVFGWAGMRGVVSLASAFSIPLLGSDGQAFPQRNLILFITFMVILITLVVQGLTLPIVIRLVHPPDKDGLLPEHEQEAEIQLHLYKAALHRLRDQHSGQISENDLVANLEDRLENDIRLTTQWLEAEECDEHEQEDLNRYHAVFTDLVRAQRRELARLRRNGNYDDELLRRQEAQLDLEEERVHQFSSLIAVKS